ncbi:MAG: TonB family protein [candidate division Zixibacteria bacterium]|nr:TonB family protein [candidate division Zixibacteria bacterium]
MTDHHQASAYARTPTLFRESTAFLMKAAYQRHMLYGIAVAVTVVLLPALLASYWPIEQADMIEVRPAPKDTIIVDWSDDKFKVIPDQPPIPAGGRAGSPSAGTGLLVDKIRLVTDFDEFKTEAGFGPGNQGGFGPEDDWEAGGGLGFGGVAFVADTAVYQFFSAELDRTPSLVFMPQPEYPPLARRAGVEGKVLLWVLVDIEGRAREVRVHEESNPGYGFGDYAARAARGAAFAPAISNHQPVRCWVSIPVVFELE